MDAVMNLPLDRKIPRDFAGAGADGGLACAVEINESVKRIVALAAHINKIGVNAILLAHRAGDLAGRRCLPEAVPGKGLSIARALISDARCGSAP